MGRRLLLGMAIVMGIVAAGDGPEAAAGKPGSAPHARTGLTFTSGWAEGEPTLRAEGRGVRFFKRVGRDRVLIRVEVAGDRVEVEANTKGIVRVDRNGKLLRLQIQGQFKTALTKIQKLTSGSAALEGLENLAAALEGENHQEARSVMTSYALLHALRGSVGPSRSMALAASPAKATGVVQAMATVEENPSACWADYATTVNQYLVEFNACTDSYWWIPGWNAACAAQFALQGELAFFWLISCSGGMPV